MCNTLTTSQKKQPKPKIIEKEAIESVEVSNLKMELKAVKTALEDQFQMLQNVQNDLKNKNEILNKKELQIESLKQTIGMY